MINSCLFVLLFSIPYIANWYNYHCSTTPGWYLYESVRFLQAMQEYGGPSARGACNVQKYTRKHNKGICVGFIKPSRCLMGWELILRSTMNSKDFFNLNNFKEECCLLNNDNLLDVLVFDVSCFVLYAPMRVLRLADQQTTLMDKHYFFILQTDWI